MFDWICTQACLLRKDIIFNFGCHTLTIGSKYFVVIWNTKQNNIHITFLLMRQFFFFFFLRFGRLQWHDPRLPTASPSVRRAAANISMHLSLTESPVASWGRSGAQGEKLGDIGLVGVVGDLGVSHFPFLEGKVIKYFVNSRVLRHLLGIYFTGHIILFNSFNYSLTRHGKKWASVYILVDCKIHKEKNGAGGIKQQQSMFFKLNSICYIRYIMLYISKMMWLIILFTLFIIRHHSTIITTTTIVIWLILSRLALRPDSRYVVEDGMV